MKPTLVLGGGTMFSATTPLWYTLSHDNKICHTGHHKEHHYLYLLANRDRNTSEIKNIRRKFYDRPLYQKTNEYYKNELYLDPGDWTEEEIDEFFSPEFTLEKYVRYYQKLSERNPDYPMVADFSTKNNKINLQKFEVLKDYFDIKVLIIFRDPIRRWWSQCHRMTPNDPGLAFVGRELDGREIKLRLESYYTKVFDKFQSIFPDTYVIIMEEFFDGKVEPVEKFLGCKINKIHDNVYWPELGPKAPRYKGLKDQWSDTRPLEPELLDIGKKRFYNIYKDFENRFGYIPEAWHKV